MKKLLCFFLFIVVQLTFSQQNENGISERQISLTAIQPITVTIGGEFIVTGSFVASRFQRLDQFVTTVFLQAQQNALRNLAQIETMKEISKEINKYALRDITLKRINGEVLKIDLLRFRLTGDFKYNPYLMNDDVIIFPAYDNEKSVVNINGAVNKPTKFQFVAGDKLNDAILFAGGLNPGYENIAQAEISRLDKTGNKEQVVLINIKDDINLQAGDRVRILADENQKSDYKVLVLGQVKKPGYIYITKDGLTLPEILNKAGGISENADLKRAEIIRDKSSIDILRKNNLINDYLDDPQKLLMAGSEWKRQLVKDSLSIARLSSIVDEDLPFFNIDNTLRILKSESLVDFTKIGDPNSDESKFLVKEGDLVLIPDKFDYVYVFGQVGKIGYVKFSEGKDYTYYVEKSGGLAESAEGLEESVIIKGKEMNWITKEKGKVKIEPGDFIYVPKNIPRSFWYTMSKVATVATVVTAIVTTILAFK
jgi:protein involved in polysaccharide export with SLBB domain